jgi:sialidase-1
VVYDSPATLLDDFEEFTPMRSALLIILITAADAPSVAATAPETPVVVFENGREGYGNYRIPALIRAANGDLLAFCEARTGGDASEIDLVMKRSTDLGATWSDLQAVRESEGFRKYFDGEAPPITVGNPAPIVDLLDPQHPGRIWLPFTLENDRVFVTYSDDHGATWAPEREITESVKLRNWGWYATGPVHSIQLQYGPHRGRLVVPADHRVGDGGADRGPNGAQVIYSDDHGRSWHLGAIDDTYDDGLHANETTVVELSDGRLYFNTRDQNGPAPGTRGEAWSTDGGKTFEPVTNGNWQAFSPCPESLDPPVVECSLLRIQHNIGNSQQDVVLFCGPDEDGPSGPGRSDLRLRYSTDDARSWKDGPLIHVGPAAYSDMAALAEGSDRIGILFEAGLPSGPQYNRIVFTSITTNRILAGP